MNLRVSNIFSLSYIRYFLEKFEPVYLEVPDNFSGNEFKRVCR